jgi:transcriptional regulator with XRE-family HTH domain
MGRTLTNDIALRLSAARRVSYDSARHFAKEFGVAESTYSQHENGKRALSVTALWEYGRWLGVEPGWLLSGKGLPYPQEARECTEKQAALFYQLDALDKERLYEEEQRYLIKDGYAMIDVDVLKRVMTTLVDEMKNSVDIDADIFLEFVIDTYNSVIQMSASLDDKKKMIELSVLSLIRGLKSQQKEEKKDKSA